MDRIIGRAIETAIDADLGWLLVAERPEPYGAVGGGRSKLVRIDSEADHEPLTALWPW
ncbi:hypothetical protein IPZ58_36970 [Streptomyces roseoverticillatus]|uniref:hypothetical protein n=1 Tax=Streptomyces roseoverticillatus TaxID=66429 RepID=UPI001F428E7D|nr:hypothetical protein [Streptomyces roseoverticillatus]MCF3107104.1 hypothetical protein [Streptomyces roseoverticillatus]